MFSRLFKVTLYLQIILISLKNGIAFKIRDNISDYDWSVWCKFQANGYDCTHNQPMQPRFYYDAKMQDCKTFTFGLCHKSKNEFETITACHENCQDVGQHETRSNVSAKIFCRYQPEFGECNSYHPMWYYDITARMCKGFSYSGCGGNLNRFVTSQMCVSICGDAVEY